MGVRRVIVCDRVRPDGGSVLINIGGSEAVALGSDFDGGPIANDLPDCAALPALVRAMEAGGLPPRQIEAACWDNWLRVLADTID